MKVNQITGAIIGAAIEVHLEVHRAWGQDY